MSKTENKVVLITGASAGIGKASAELFLSRGYTVYNLSRSASPVSGIENIAADVSDREAVKAAVSGIIKSRGRIDILINCAGFGISGAAEDTEDADIKRIFDVNFFGAVYTAQCVVPHMREKARGRIINVSSVAARLAIPFQAFYSASKSALCGFSEALRLEVLPFNIKTTAILPGDVKTEFTLSRKKNKYNNPAYGKRVENSVSRMEKDESNGLPASVIARQIFRLTKKRNPPARVTGGRLYAVLLFLTRFLPNRLIEALIGGLYGR